MEWSLRIARVAGIDVRIHLTFLFLLAWIGFTHYSVGGWTEAVSGILFILTVFLSVLLHEFGHALAAARYGIRTPDITLLPIGGVARLERMPTEPRQELVVALAGPLVNVVIAALLYLYLVATGYTLGSMTTNLLDVPLVHRILVVNVTLVLFNLLPAFPMDGGRVLRAILASRMEYARATEWAARVGQAFAFIFGFIGLLVANPLLIFIALFVYLGASQESRMAQMKAISHGLPVASAMVTRFDVLHEDDSLRSAVDSLLAGHQQEFPVVNLRGEVVGMLTREAMIQGLSQRGLDARIGEVMLRGLPLMEPGEMLEPAYERMQQAGCRATAVVDRLGNLVGMLTMENIAEMMMVHSALRRQP